MIRNGRIAFSFHEDFYKFFYLIDNGEFLKINTISNYENFKSLYSEISSNLISDDELTNDLKSYQDFGLPSSFQLLLNNRGEVIIGNDIVWYNKGKIFYQ